MIPVPDSSGCPVAELISLFTAVLFTGGQCINNLFSLENIIVYSVGQIISGSNHFDRKKAKLQI